MSSLVVRLDLNQMKFRTAIRIVNFCAERGVDAERAEYYHNVLRGRASIREAHDDHWYLDVPGHYVTWFTMQWGELYA